MKKTKQILAIIGIIILVGMYVLTLLSAILDNSNTMGYFKAAIFATIVIPVLIWAYQLVYNLIHKNNKKDDNLE